MRGLEAASLVEPPPHDSGRVQQIRDDGTQSVDPGWAHHDGAAHWSTSSRRLGTPITGAEAGVVLAPGAYSQPLIEPALAANRSEHSVRRAVSYHKQQATAIGLHDASDSFRPAREGGGAMAYQSMSGKT